MLESITSRLDATETILNKVQLTMFPDISVTKASTNRDLDSDYNSTTRFFDAGDRGISFPQTLIMACNPSNDLMFILPWFRVTFGILMMLENSVSLWALGHVRRLPHSVLCFLRSIAVAELLTGTWCCYCHAAEVLIGSKTVSLECRLRYIVTTYLNFVAIFSICALCLDRCLTLHAPFRYFVLVTKTRVHVILGVIWVSPIFVVLLAYFSADGKCSDCSFAAVISQRTLVVLTVLRVLTIAAIVATQVMLFRAANCRALRIYPSALSSARQSTHFSHINAKAAVTTAAVAVSFLLLYAPLLVVHSIVATITDYKDHVLMLTTAWLFASAHGLLTPIIFCWRFTEVRDNITRLFCLCVRQPEVEVYHCETITQSVHITTQFTIPFQHHTAV